MENQQTETVLLLRHSPDGFGRRLPDQVMPEAKATHLNCQVKVIVPFAAGGPTDVMARLIAQKLSESLKQQFYRREPSRRRRQYRHDDCRAARIPTATRSWWRARASWSIRASTPRIPTIPSRTSSRSRSPRPRRISWWCNPELPVKTVKELVDLLKANPVKYSIANPGIGTTPQLAAELFKLALKLDATSVPFGGAAPAIQSTVGEPDADRLCRDAAGRAASQGRQAAWRSRSPRPKRSSALPDVPTMAEAGVTGPGIGDHAGRAGAGRNAEGDRRSAAIAKSSRRWRCRT